MSYRVWAEVFNADGVRLGVIPDIEAVKVTRILDGAGSVSLTLPGMSERALTLLTYEARVRVYLEQNNQTREVGRGIVRKPVTTDTPGGTTLTVDCPDELCELKDISVLLGRSYGDASPVSLESVVSSLVGLVDGWTASVEAGVSGNLVSLRVDGVSILKALQELAENNGLHLRQSIGSKTLEFGAFGTDTGIYLRNVAHGNIRLQDNDNLAIVENLQITGTSEGLVNRIYPVGAGQGLAAINLENSTRTAPYTINSVTGPDGRTLRYIETGERPVREEVRRYKITPIANSAAAKEVADDALYDAAAADLARSSVVQETYRVVLTKVRRTIRAGDTVRLVFKGIVQQKGGAYVYRNVNDTFTVLEVDEDFSPGGVKTSLVISNVDRMMMSIEKQVITAINDVKASKFEVVTFPYWSENTYTDFIQSVVAFPDGKNAEFILEIDKDVTDVLKVRIRFVTKPLYTLTIPAEVAQTAGQATILNHKIRQSAYYPSDVSLWINGVDRSSAYGGNWNPASYGALDVALDITEDIVNASGGLYQKHTIVFKCQQFDSLLNTVSGFSTLGTGSPSAGVVELNIRVIGITQAIKTT